MYLYLEIDVSFDRNFERQILKKNQYFYLGLKIEVKVHSVLFKKPLVFGKFLCYKTISFEVPQSI